MKTEKGFSLIELLVAMAVIAISVMAFLSFALSGIKQRSDLQKRITAQTMATDIAERLQKLPATNSLVTPDGGAAIRVGYNSSGALLKCSSGSPTDTLSADLTGMTALTKPFGAGGIYLYDANTGTPTITPAVNSDIHHPNATDITNWSTVSSAIAPIRNIGGTTFYAVWSVAYMPCSSATDLAKIFVTVYWIEPEPSDTSSSVVAGKISSGQYNARTVSVSSDKAYKIETKAGGS